MSPLLPSRRSSCPWLGNGAAPLALAVLLLIALPSRASADWFFTPFFGWDFAGSTTLIDLEYLGASRTKVTIGGSALLTHGIFGVEADYAFVPRFFQNPDRGTDPLNPNAPQGATLASSHVQTVTGNLLLLAPLSLTQESLRPYLAAGFGLTHAVSEDILGAVPVNCNLPAFDIGGGAIGMLGERTGLRFDLRRFSTLGGERPSCNAIAEPRVTFWRGTIGVTLRY
jgi:hypothetical protein